MARVILDTDTNNQLSLNGVLVRDVQRQRDGVPSDLMTADPETILGDDRNDIIIEVMGGEEPARSYMAAAISAGKHVVTANKEALAKHGDELTDLAAQNGVSLSYEASVGGGIPVLATVQDSLSANRIESIRAIINGTTTMCCPQWTSPAGHSMTHYRKHSNWDMQKQIPPQTSTLTMPYTNYRYLQGLHLEHPHPQKSSTARASAISGLKTFVMPAPSDSQSSYSQLHAQIQTVYDAEYIQR